MHSGIYVPFVSLKTALKCEFTSIEFCSSVTCNPNVHFSDIMARIRVMYLRRLCHTQIVHCGFLYISDVLQTLFLGLFQSDPCWYTYYMCVCVCVWGEILLSDDSVYSLINFDLWISFWIRKMRQQIRKKLTPTFIRIPNSGLHIG